MEKKLDKMKWNEVMSFVLAACLCEAPHREVDKKKGTESLIKLRAQLVIKILNFSTLLTCWERFVSKSQDWWKNDRMWSPTHVQIQGNLIFFRIKRHLMSSFSAESQRSQAKGKKWWRSIFPSLKIQKIIFPGNILLFFQGQMMLLWRWLLERRSSKLRWLNRLLLMSSGGSKQTCEFLVFVYLCVFMRLPQMSSKGSKQTCESLKSLF